MGTYHGVRTWGVVLLVVGLVGLLGSVGEVWAGFEEGVQAYERGDYATALREWRPLAEHGDTKAQNNLGLMYHEGQGVPQDYTQAAMWYRRAADQGEAEAQHNLGGMYADGQGVPQDYAQAVIWYRRAAEQGDALAQVNLGLMYYNGQGVPQDYAQAYLWSNLAAARLPPSADRETAVRNRDRIAARLTPAQLADAQARARTWQPKPETPMTGKTLWKKLYGSPARPQGTPPPGRQPQPAPTPLRSLDDLARDMLAKKQSQPPQAPLDFKSLSDESFARQKAQQPQPSPQDTAVPPPAAASLRRDLIREVQERLHAAGFHPGAIDGGLGPQTRSALRWFQNTKGLLSTGEPDEQTLDALGVR